MLFSDREDNMWVWEYDTGEGSADLHVYNGSKIRFRVISETFVDCTPDTPELAGATGAAVLADESRSPYSLTVSDFFQVLLGLQNLIMRCCVFDS